MDETTRPIIIEKTVLTLDEVVEYTGFEKAYMYRLMSERRIPYYKPTGKSAFFSKAELDAWLLSNPVKTRDELNSEASTYTHSRR